MLCVLSWHIKRIWMNEWMKRPLLRTVVFSRWSCTLMNEWRLPSRFVFCWWTQWIMICSHQQLICQELVRQGRWHVWNNELRPCVTGWLEVDSWLSSGPRISYNGLSVVQWYWQMSCLTTLYIKMSAHTDNFNGLRYSQRRLHVDIPCCAFTLCSDQCLCVC